MALPEAAGDLRAGRCPIVLLQTVRLAAMVKGTFCLTVVGALALAGCVSYEPKPLDLDPSIAPSLSALAPAQHGALTIPQLDRLVLANNPDLRAARAKLGIGEAQIIEAGLLPNPQLAFSYPFFAGGAPGTDAFSAGISQDLRSIILRPSKLSAAANAASEINASLLWQEWQTIGKARILFVDIVAGDREEKVIERTRKVLKDRFDRSKAAVDQGSTSLATLSPDLAAVSDIQKLYDDLERLQFSRRHQLNALLGLAPDAPLNLSGGGEPPTIDVSLIKRDLADLADRRPDLIALQYGYRSQEAKLRQAILAQFPNVAIGITGGRDNSGVYSVGPQISFELPIFNRNEGAIAAESASREALGREFNARLTSAVSEVESLLSEQALLRKQLTSIAPRFKEAHSIATESEKAYKQSLLDERAYVDTQVAQLTIERQQVELQQSLLEGQVSLATLTGAGLPHVTIAPEPPHDDMLGLFQGAAR